VVYSFFGWCSVLIVYVGLWEYFICGFVGARTDSLEAYALPLSLSLSPSL
jgi:hypothetical protein